MGATFAEINEETQRHADPDARAAIEAMKGQLLLVLVNRLGGKVTIPVSEIDGTGSSILKMSVDPLTKEFTFIVEKKQ
jgi:hypothetical protein